MGKSFTQIGSFPIMLVTTGDRPEVKERGFFNRKKESPRLEILTCGKKQTIEIADLPKLNLRSPKATALLIETVKPIDRESWSLGPTARFLWEKKDKKTYLYMFIVFGDSGWFAWRYHSASQLTYCVVDNEQLCVLQSEKESVIDYGPTELPRTEWDNDKARLIVDFTKSKGVIVGNIAVVLTLNQGNIPFLQADYPIAATFGKVPLVDVDGTKEIAAHWSAQVLGIRPSCSCGIDCALFAQISDPGFTTSGEPQGFFEVTA
jgi:hypothetical protein